MNDKINEQISAWVDDELPEAERDLLARRLVQDPELARHWKHYHLISDALHSQLPERVDINLADRVAEALRDEPVPAAQGGSSANWHKRLAGMAIAASVAVAAVLVVRQADTPVESTIQVAEQSALPGPEQYRRIEGTQWAKARPQVADQLNQYLVNHNEYAARNGHLGVSPHVRIVGYDAPASGQQ